MTKLDLRAEQLERIRRLVKAAGRVYEFLGYRLDLETGEFHDLLEKGAEHGGGEVKVIAALLAHYSLAEETLRTGKLVKFKDLPGGYAFERAFIQRAVDPISQIFGYDPTGLVEAAEVMGGKSLSYGNVSVEVQALEGIPIVFILWAAQEFPATANLLFDESAGCFLDTESLAVLGELTTHRLLKAHSILGKSRGEKPVPHET